MNNVEVEPLRRKPRAVDLFCGCGGLTLGLKQAGFKVIGGLDNDPVAVRTYKMNHAGVCVWECDIRQLSIREVKKVLNLRKGELDLLAGCPPCQGFSTMRTLNRPRSVRDHRNSLIDEFLRFVRGLLPKAVMMENVPRLKKYHRFRSFCRELRRLGYVVCTDVQDAADYGVAQRRRRTILLAGRARKIEFGEKAENHIAVRDIIGSIASAGSSGDELHDFPERRSEKVMALIRGIPKNGGSRTDLGAKQQLPCHKKCSGFKDVYGRMAWADVAPTITSGCTNPSKGRFLHPRLNRAITLREAALLQGFPMNYRFSLKGGKGKTAELIGNALPPPFVAAHAASVKRALPQIAKRKGR